MKQHDIDYMHARNLEDKWVANKKMIRAIEQLPGKKKLTEKVVRRIMKAETKI